MRWQLLVQGGLHGFLVTGLARTGLQHAVAENPERRQRCEFVIGVFFQPAYLCPTGRVVAVQPQGLFVGLIEVLTDHAGVSQTVLPILHGRNAAEWVELQIPFRWGERHDEFEPIIQSFFL